MVSPNKLVSTVVTIDSVIVKHECTLSNKNVQSFSSLSLFYFDVTVQLIQPACKTETRKIIYKGRNKKRKVFIMTLT